MARVARPLAISMRRWFAAGRTSDDHNVVEADDGDISG
jgi:hypothetical protein